LKIKREDIEKIRKPFRLLAAIVALCGLLATGICVVFLFLERDLKFVPIILPMILFTYFMLVAAITGYPPKYLYWTSSAKE
jgi:hypothetical protein